MIPFLGRAPDGLCWDAEPAYNAALAKLFMDVYREISDEAHRPTAEQMEQARKRLLTACEQTPTMSKRQQCSLAILRCQLALGGASGASAVQALREARDLLIRPVEPLVDGLALAECDFLAGWCRQGQRDYVGAANCFSSAVDRLKRERTHSPQLGDAAFELRALSALAVQRFLLADYAEAERHVDEGLELSHALPHARSQRAMLLWTRALVQRWRGNLEDALTCAFNAADLLERDPKNVSFGRIQAVAGEIALDLAERYCAEEPAHGRMVWLEIARARIEEAASIAQTTHDRPGKVLAVLARVRYGRMRHEQVDRVHIISRASKLAQNDTTLLCQIETALGHEADASGDREHALKCYRNAVDLVNRHTEQPAKHPIKLSTDESEPLWTSDDATLPESSKTLAQAFLVWPRRELLRWEEMSR